MQIVQNTSMNLSAAKFGEVRKAKANEKPDSIEKAFTHNGQVYIANNAGPVPHKHMLEELEKITHQPGTMSGFTPILNAATNTLELVFLQTKDVLKMTYKKLETLQSEWAQEIESAESTNAFK